MTSLVLPVSVMGSLRIVTECSGSSACDKAGACVHSCRAGRQALMTDGRVPTTRGLAASWR